ncbi:hypothetical protein FIBSPDRAFT_862135 [Athelia psychrophila]|uniref:Uncharacterized protein n=1 Tax=Athelia psychrophila TaxID=1759441 RepID=A0A166IKT5_9AGAM|nr:hypothetical protein FIBSPDRAFT_862135 [Fibularhizoctonia sp. CBS 109695]
MGLCTYTGNMHMNQCQIRSMRPAKSTLCIVIQRPRIIHLPVLIDTFSNEHRGEALVPCTPFLAKYAGAGQRAGLDEQRDGGDGDGGEEGVQYGGVHDHHPLKPACILILACAFRFVLALSEPVNAGTSTVIASTND